ncbi:hypothetical protein F5Y18DRAFT_440516 [Xylariaceae sp. FL1019]|nr:hypothetical protein F5Y18DRAFT_440516 [Xylariaceae sp. FL1019]
MEASSAHSIYDLLLSCDAKLFAYIVTGVWITRRKMSHRNESVEPSICPTGGWSLNLTCANGQILSIIPVARSNEPDSSVRVELKEILSPQQAALGDPRSALYRMSEERYGRRALPGTTALKLMIDIFKCDLANYGLKQFRGRRYWLLLALIAIKDHYDYPPLYDWPLTDNANIRLRYHQSDEDDDAPMEETDIVFGTLPINLSDQACRMLRECQDRLYSLEQRLASGRGDSGPFEPSQQTALDHDGGTAS